jgi:hypothetical protein
MNNEDKPNIKIYRNFNKPCFKTNLSIIKWEMKENHFMDDFGLYFFGYYQKVIE